MNAASATGYSVEGSKITEHFLTGVCVHLSSAPCGSRADPFTPSPPGDVPGPGCGEYSISLC